MKKKFTFLIAAIALLVFLAPSMAGWGQTRDTKSYTLTISGSDFNTTSYAANNNEKTSNAIASDNSTYEVKWTSNQVMKNGDNMQWQKSNGYIYNSTDLGTITSVTVNSSAGSFTTYYGTSEHPTSGNSVGNGFFTTKVGGATGTTSSVVIVFTIETGGGSYTITAESNNTNYGTVSLSGSVITGSPNSGYRYASPAYTVSSGTATVSQSGNDFTVTPSSDCTVTINFEAIPTHTATFSVNGATSSQNYLEGAAITFPSDPANISGKKFVGWITTTIAEPTDEEPSFVNTATETMGSNNVTYYAVFATATASGDPVETKTQTLQYDTWTYGGTTSDQTSYRLFGNTGYVKSSAFDLSKLSKVIVYGGTYGGSSNNSLTIGDGTNTWKSVTVSGSSNTGTNTYTDGTPLTGTKALYVTSNSGNASGSGVRMSKVEIFTMETQYTYSGYCTSVEVYTITAVSNNTDYGTVSLSGEVITGSPQSGYRYATPAYTVSPANSATVVQDGNEFTVTPSANTIVTINFELIPTYTLSSAVSPENAGMVTLGASSGLLEGATVSAEAAANAGYKFTGWSISGTGATLSSTTDNPTTVTIGTENATVTANFEAVPTHAITYNVNGITNTVNVEENTAVDLSAPESELIPLGYVFKGWRTSTLPLTDTDPADYITSATSTANITYYAVMAVDNVNYVTTHLTGVEIAANFAASAMSYSDAEKSYTDTDESMTWSARCNTNATRHWIQLKNDNNVYIKAVAPQNITEVKVTISNSTNDSGGIDDITKHGAFSGSVNLDTVQNNNAGSCGTAASSAIVNNILTINADGTSNTIYIHVTAAARVWNVDVTYASINATNFCTSVSPITLAEDVTINGDLNISYKLTVPSGKTLTVTGNLINNNASNLVIEDGGQLIFHDNGAKDAVQATVKKDISAATNWGVESSGWNFIASPLSSNTTPASVANMITADIEEAHTYDLYRYDGSKPKDYWENYRNEEHTDGFNLVNGQGYLYANQSDVTLEFAGTIQPSDEKEITGLNSGYNLVGNPFTCNAILNTSYYKLNATGDVISSVSVDESNPIAPCTGVIIYGPSVTFTPTTDAAVLSSGKGNVEMVLAQTVATRNGENTTTLDNAIVSFNEGSELPKFYFGTQNANIYIPMDNEEFAIVSSNGQGEMPVNFRAYVAGEYTITVNPEEVEMGYLHLIDNIAGKDVDLLANPSYTFNARTDDYESRFRLVFSTTMVNAEMGEDFAFMSGGQLVIANEGEATLQVIDVTGRVVATESINGTCSKAVNAKAGVYVLRLINGTDVKTQKMVIR